MKLGIKHSFKTVNHENFGLSVYNCGFQKCKPLYSWGPAMKDHHIIHIVASGSGTFSCKDKKYSLSAGDGFICMAGELINYCADENTPWEYYWVGFKGEDADKLIKSCNLSADTPCFHTTNVHNLILHIMKIYESNGNSLYNEVLMNSHLYRFFAELFKETQSESNISSISTDYITFAIKYIEYNYSNDISITDIAENSGISRSHLYRLFMSQLKMTPNEYLIQFRITNACKLLRESNVNISEAAYSSGFSDPLYFSRVFKKLKGITPSEYLKQQKRHS